MFERVLCKSGIFIEERQDYISEVFIHCSGTSIFSCCVIPLYCEDNHHTVLSPSTRHKKPPTV